MWKIWKFKLRGFRVSDHKFNLLVGRKKFKSLIRKKKRILIKFRSRVAFCMCKKVKWKYTEYFILRYAEIGRQLVNLTWMLSCATVGEEKEKELELQKVDNEELNWIRLFIKFICTRKYYIQYISYWLRLTSRILVFTIFWWEWTK